MSQSPPYLQDSISGPVLESSASVGCDDRAGAMTEVRLRLLRGWIGGCLVAASLLAGCGHTDAGRLDYSAAKFMPDFLSSDLPPQSEPELEPSEEDSAE